MLVTGHVRIWYIRKSFHLHLRAEGGEGRLILSLLFKCLFEIGYEAYTKDTPQEDVSPVGIFFFFFSPLRETHCGIGPRCRPSGNTAK